MGAINTTKWTIISGGNCTTNGSGSALIRGTGGGNGSKMYSTQTFTSPCVIEIKQTNIPLSTLSYDGVSVRDVNGTWSFQMNSAWESQNVIWISDNSNRTSNSGIATGGTLHDLKFDWQANGMMNYYIDNSLMFTGTVGKGGSSAVVQLSVYETGTSMLSDSVYIGGTLYDNFSNTGDLGDITTLENLNISEFLRIERRLNIKVSDMIDTTETVAMDSFRFSASPAKSQPKATKGLSGYLGRIGAGTGQKMDGSMGLSM